MRQLFFIPAAQFKTYPQIPGASFHIWNDGNGLSVGAVHMNGSCDCEQVIACLESYRCSWLPNHFGTQTISAAQAQQLARFGVLPTDTTLQAMTKVHATAGFPPLKPRRF